MELNHISILVVHPICFNVYDIEVEILAGCWNTDKQCQLAARYMQPYIFAYLPPTGFAAAITEQRA